MKKNKTKSILTCAVLASVLAGGMLPVQVASAEAVSKNTVSVVRDKVVSGELRKIEYGAQKYVMPGMTVQELFDTSIYRKPSVQHDNILILDPQDYTGWQSFIWGAELGWVGGGWEIPEKDFYYEKPSDNVLARDVFVYNNELIIKSGSFLKDVYGATDYCNPVFNNTINILGDTVISGNVYGGRARRRLEGNKVNITDGVTIGGNVYGGYTDENYYIYISGEDTGGTHVLHVIEDTYKIVSNEVNLSGNVTVAGNVYGGYSIAERRDFDGNVVSLNDRATVAGNVYGAWEYRADEGYPVTINNNVVNINNEATADKVYGGYLKLGENYGLRKEDVFGTIEKNVVNLRGGQVDTVYGVYIDTVGFKHDTQATNNTVNLYSTKVNNIFGAYQADEEGYRAAGLPTATGNRLNIFSVGNTVEKLGGFQEFNFIVPSGVVPGGTAMLTLADQKYKVNADGENINAQAVFATNTLKRGDVITLVANHRGWDDFFSKVSAGYVETSTNLNVGFDLYAYTGWYESPASKIIFRISKDTPVPGEYCITVDGANISNIYGTKDVQYGAVKGTHYDYIDNADKTFYTKKYNDSWKNWLTVDLKENATYKDYSWYGVKTEGADDAHGVLNMKSGNAKVVSGGYASGSGDASGNHVILQGGTVAEVYGGIATTGDATDNNIHLLGGTVTKIHGGKNDNGITTGNTLTTYTFGNTIRLVDGVDNLNFIVADRNLNAPMLTINSGSQTNINDLNIQVGVVTSGLYGSDVITLLHNEKGITGTPKLPERLLADEDWQNTDAKVNQDVVSEISKALEEKYATLILDGLINYKAKFVVDDKNIYLTIDTDGYGSGSCDPEDFKIVVDDTGTPRSAGEIYDAKYGVKGTDFFVRQPPELEWERELTIYKGYNDNSNFSYYAAKEESRDATLGTITLAGGTVQNLYAGYSADGNVYENTAVVTRGTVSNVYGGYGTNGEVHENRVAVNGVTVSGGVYGGYSTNGNTYENEVTVSGGTVGNLYGGWSAGDSHNNRVTLENGATVTGNLYGSYSTKGVANHNTVILKKGTVTGDVYAGHTDVTENKYHGETGYNTVHLLDAQVNGKLSGGNITASFDYKEHSNKLYVYNTDRRVDDLYNFQQINLIVPEGQTADQITMLSVKESYHRAQGEPSINIQVGIVDKNLPRNAKITLLEYEGVASKPYSYSYSDYSAAQIDGVLEGTPSFVQYKGTYIGNEHGVYFYVDSDADIPADFCITVDGNNVSTQSGVPADIKYDYDGEAFSMKVNSNPKNWANELILNLENTTQYSNKGWYGVKVKAADLEANPDAKDAHGILRMKSGKARFLAGGYGSDTGSNANYNEVYFEGGELVNFQKYKTAIYGGDAPGGEANYNKVYLKGGTVAPGEIYGGYSNRKGVSYNSVYLQGTTVNNNTSYNGVIYGGYNTINTPKDSLNDVVGNHVYLQSGRVYKVYAGYSDNNFTRDNTVDLDPNGNLTVNEIYGSDRADNGVNNTLNVLNANSKPINIVANFQNIDFTLPKNIADNTQMLNVANAVNLSNVAVHVYLNGQEPDSITLINNVKNSGVYSVYTGAGAGAELTEDYTISVDNNSLVLKAGVVLWYTVGDEEKKFAKNAGMQSISDVNGDVTIYRGTAYNEQMQGNQYGSIDATGYNVTIDSKNPLTVTGNLTAKTVMINADRTLIMDSGNKLKANNGVNNSGTLNVSAGDLLSKVANNGTVNLGEGTLATGKTITGGIVKITEDVSTIGTNLLDGSGNNMNVQITDGKTLIVSGGSLAVAVGDSSHTTGTVKFTGTTTAGKEIYTAVEVGATTGALTVAADLLKNESNNNYGTLTLTGVSKTLGNSISGSGKTIVDGSVTVENGKSIEQSILTINSGKSLAADVDALTIGGVTGSITNEGILTLNADGSGDNSLQEGVTGGAASILNFNGNNKITAEGAITQGTVNVNTDVDMNAALTAAVNVVANKTLTIGAGNLKGDVANSGIVALNAGTLADGYTITGGTLNINDNVTANASDIMGNTNMVAENKILTLNGGSTIAKTISGAGTLKVAGDMSVNADNLQTSTTLVESGKTLTITGGIFDKKVGGEGTLNITGTLHFGNNAELVQTGTQTVDGRPIPVSNVNITLADGGTFDVRDRENTTGGCINTLTFAGGRIDASGGRVGNMLVAKTLDASTNGGGFISFDVAGTGAGGTNTNDQIGVLNSVESGSKLNLDSINVVGELAGDVTQGYAEGSIDFVQDLSGNNILTNLTIAGQTTTMSDNYMYTFTPGTNGQLNYRKETGAGLKQVIQAKDINDAHNDSYAQIATYSFTGDRGKNFEPYSANKIAQLTGEEKTKAENLNKRFGNLGEMGHATGETTRTLTIVGNGSELSGGTYEGVTVRNGDTLVLKNISAITDAENNIIATNNGTVMFTGSGTTDVRATIQGEGTLIVDGVNVVLGENYQYVTGREEDISTEHGWKLNSDGSYVTTLSENTSASITQKDLEIRSGSLTANASNLHITNGIVNNGEMTFTGGTLSTSLTGAGQYINSGTLTVANASNLRMTKAFKNTGTLELQGGNLEVEITDITSAAGTTIISGTVTNTGEKEIFQKNLNIASGGNFTTSADRIYSVEVINDDGNLSLTGGKLERPVQGTGNITFVGDVTTIADNIATTGTNTVETGKKLILDGGTLTQKVQGPGNLNFTGDVTTNAENVATTGINEVATGVTVTFTGGAVNRAITNNGTVKLNGATLGGAYVTGGTLEFVKNMEVDADYVLADVNTVDAGITLVLGSGTLNKVISGAGNVTIGNGTDAVTMEVDLNLFTNTGDLTVADNSTLQTNVAVNRKINGGGTVEFTDNVTITDRVEINRLATKGKVITVGNDVKAGYVDAKEIQLKGGMIFLDPIWENGVGVEGATHVATQTANLDGAYVVGRNSILTFGTTNENGDVQFKLSGLKWGQNDISAATYVAKNINVSDGSLTIDGSLTAAPTAPEKGTVNMAANSLLMVKGDICDTAAVSGITGTDIKVGANLYVTNVQEGTVYKIMTGNDIAAQNLTTFLPYGFVLDEEKVIFNDKEVTIQFKPDRDAGKDTVIPNIIRERDGELKEYVTEISDRYVGNVEKVTEEINNMANLGENLGVSRGAYDVANMVGDAIDSHWDSHHEDKDVWAVGTHSKETVDGIELGGMDAQYDAQYNGAVVGVNLSGNFGMAINYTDGKVNNHLGGHNDAEYYGGSLYAKTDWGNLRITADATYTHGKNELSQNGITADAKTDTVSGGLMFKYMAKSGMSKIGPFAGIRYMHIDGKDYTDSLGVNREADKINSVVVPVGLEYTGEFKMPKSEWTWKPVLMAGYLFNIGDRSNDMFLRYNGAMDTFAYDLVDKGAFFARAGMNFSNKNFNFGLGYDYTKSSNTDNNRWNFNMDYNFGTREGLPYKSVLLGKIDLLENANKELRAENVELKAENVQLKAEVAELKVENERKDLKIAELEALLKNK